MLWSGELSDHLTTVRFWLSSGGSRALNVVRITCLIMARPACSPDLLISIPLAALWWPNWLGITLCCPFPVRPAVTPPAPFPIPDWR
jgi:hypothetical protein